MKKLYTLTFYDNFEERQEEFFIGVFELYDEAEGTAKKYLNNVPGFKDYHCKYDIKIKNVIDETDRLESVSIIRGWNSCNDMNNYDIWESDLYADKSNAHTALADIQKEIIRQEWCIDTYKIGECHWCEGFVRI